ncbi:NUMOD4 domain-containing protein [Chryseobacterium defluvii]|nr:NUMOD4 domain-containing protein [Chryseobacterium defluvii]
MNKPLKIEDKYLTEVLYNTSLRDLPQEEWKSVEGFDNYAISNYGRLKRLERWTYFPYGKSRKEPERIIKIYFRKYFNKYLNCPFYVAQCALSFNGTRYTKSIARLVYYHFVEKFDLNNRSIAISYKDSNSLHLNYKNLEKLSIREKTIKAIQKNRAKNRKIEYQKSVSQYSVDGKLIGTFGSIDAADKALCIGKNNILFVLQKKYFTAGGFRWFLKDYIPKKEDFISPVINKLHNPNTLFNTSLWIKLGKPSIDKKNPPACLNLSTENLRDEYWNPIPDFEGKYAISNKGRVKRLSGWTSDNNFFLEKNKSCPLI